MDNDSSNELPEIIESCARFRHEAMSTFYEILIVHDDYEYSRQAAQEAFTEIDRLEGELSRFVENSDVARINSLSKDESITVGIEAFECLSIAEKIYLDTFGAFDITIGALFKCWLNKDKTLRKPSEEELEQAKMQTGMKFIELDEEYMTVKILADDIRVDLGGIGKGYAIDKAMDLLKLWSIETAFVHSGGSTIVASDKPEGTDGWPVTLSLPDMLWNSDPDKAYNVKVLETIDLHNRALSGSNLEYGKHVIDPRVGKPVEGNVAAWAITENGAVADGLSTAMLVMSEDEALKYFSKYPNQSAITVGLTCDGSYQIKRYGSWK